MERKSKIIDGRIRVRFLVGQKQSETVEGVYERFVVLGDGFQLICVKIGEIEKWIPLENLLELTILDPRLLENQNEDTGMHG